MLLFLSIGIILITAFALLIVAEEKRNINYKSILDNDFVYKNHQPVYVFNNSNVRIVAFNGKIHDTEAIHKKYYPSSATYNRIDYLF